MKSSCIYIKFGSESKYERLTFSSQVVTYNEIKQHLERKKHIMFPAEGAGAKKTDKTDVIMLVDEINARIIEESERNIEANLHVVVRRTPQPQEPIVITYNPKLTGENTLGHIDSRPPKEDGDSALSVSVSESQVPLEAQQANVIKFQTSRIE